LTPRLAPAPLWSVASCRPISSRPIDLLILTLLCADRCCVMLPCPTGVDLRCECVVSALRSSAVCDAASTTGRRRWRYRTPTRGFADRRQRTGRASRATECRTAGQRRRRDAGQPCRAGHSMSRSGNPRAGTLSRSVPQPAPPTSCDRPVRAGHDQRDPDTHPAYTSVTVR
jgi:hypothetical protein